MSTIFRLIRFPDPDGFKVPVGDELLRVRVFSFEVRCTEAQMPLHKRHCLAALRWDDDQNRQSPIPLSREYEDKEKMRTELLNGWDTAGIDESGRKIIAAMLRQILVEKVSPPASAK
jgi:hypothetical protein